MTDPRLPALFLLFEAGKRPDAAALREAARQDGAYAVGLLPPGEPGWAELLAHGLIFDLHGLSPGEACETSGDFDTEGLEALALRAGPHLRAASLLAPVLRSQMWLGARLCTLPGLSALGWERSGRGVGVEAFRGQVMRWLEGGGAPQFADLPEPAEIW